MNWRKWNRWIHRELGFLFFGMTLVYAISGIALNHHVTRDWDPGLISTQKDFHYADPLDRATLSREVVEEILELCGEKDNFKQYYFPAEDQMMIYLKNGHIAVELNSGRISLTKIRKRPFFSELNYLHYNKPKKLWTWFSDLYAFSLVLIAVSGLFLIKGKKGISGRGGILTLIGVILPLIFLALYLWF